MGQLVIYGNPGLETIAGFPLLSTLGDGLGIFDNAQLTTVSAFGGDLHGSTLGFEFPRAPRQPSGCLTGYPYPPPGLCNTPNDDTDDTANRMPRADRVGSARYAAPDPTPELLESGATIYIGDNPALTDLPGMSATVHLEQLRVFDNDAPADLGGLAAATVGTWIELLDNDALVTTPEWTFETLAGLRIADNGALVSVARLSALLEIGTLQIQGNAALTTVAGLPRLANADVLQVANNPALTAVGALPALVEVGTLDISDNALLRSIGDMVVLAGVTTMDHGLPPGAHQLPGAARAGPGRSERSRTSARSRACPGCPRSPRSRRS